MVIGVGIAIHTVFLKHNLEHHSAVASAPEIFWTRSCTGLAAWESQDSVASTSAVAGGPTRQQQDQACNEGNAKREKRFTGINNAKTHPSHHTSVFSILLRFARR
jgi:hypothetical protein